MKQYKLEFRFILVKMQFSVYREEYEWRDASLYIPNGHLSIALA
jgi:hypothetical protein